MKKRKSSLVGGAKNAEARHNPEVLGTGLVFMMFSSLALAFSSRRHISFSFLFLLQHGFSKSCWRKNWLGRCGLVVRIEPWPTRTLEAACFGDNRPQQGENNWYFVCSLWSMHTVRRLYVIQAFKGKNTILVCQVLGIGSDGGEREKHLKSITRTSHDCL